MTEAYFNSEDSDESLYDHVIPAAVKELSLWKHKYKNYPQFLPVVEAIERVEKELQNDNQEEETDSRGTRGN